MAGLPISAFQDVDEFKYVKDLGSGNFGIARLCVNESTGEKVAIKYIQRGPKIDSNVAREIVNHRGLRHPNIVQFRRIALTDTHLAIVMEYASGGELFDRICDAGRFSEAEARFFFQQLISGVAYCHRKGIAHRDLKLENTLLDGSETPRLKICDFGYSKSSLLHSMPKSTVGTPAYIAPEVLVSKKYDGKIADVWSCGVTLFVMLVGGYPFEDPDDPRDYRKTIKRIVAVDYTIPGECTISPQCKDLMARIFVADPHQRISIHDIWDHPWFVENLPRDLVSPDDDVEMESEQQSIKDIEAILEQAKITGDTSLERKLWGLSMGKSSKPTSSKSKTKPKSRCEAKENTPPPRSLFSNESDSDEDDTKSGKSKGGGCHFDRRSFWEQLGGASSRAAGSRRSSSRK